MNELDSIKDRPESEPASTEKEAKKTREPNLREVISTLRHKDLYGNMAIHVFILIPVAVFLAFMSRILDRTWGWEPLVQSPWNLILALICFGVGGVIVWYSYGYLHLIGGGSPGSHMGYTQKIVMTGPYSLVRHPSNVGKLIGVIGLGILMKTTSFILIIIPILFTYSFVTTILIQEHFCIKNFGDQYRDYKREVPMFIPRWKSIRNWCKESKSK